MFALLLAFSIFSSSSRAAVAWREDLPSALASAKAKRSLVLVDFSAPWCYSCHYMDQNVLGQPEMDRVASKLELVRLDVDSSQGAELRGQYHALGLPNYVVLNADGDEVGRIVGEQTKENFFKQVGEILERNSPLAGLESEAKAGGPKAAAAAGQVLKAYGQRNDIKGGLDFYEKLPAAVKTAVDADRGSRVELLRLKLLSAFNSKDADACERYGRLLLDGRGDCDVMYDSLYLQRCLGSAPESRKRKVFEYQRRPIESMLNQGVLVDPARRCADQQSPVEAAVAFYRTVGEKKKAERLLDRMIARTRQDLGGDVARDRNKADNLATFLELAEDNKALAELYPKLAETYSKDYVYPYLYGRFLLEQRDPAKALSVLEGAKKLAYGAGVLRVANARAKALARLGRRTDAMVEIDAALKTDTSAFPKELAAIKKTREDLKIPGNR